MNTKTYFELTDANSVGRSAACLFSRITYWLSQSDLVHRGTTFCFRTLVQLAEEIGTSVSTVRRGIAELMKRGWIEKARLKAKKWNQVCCYSLGPNAPRGKAKRASKHRSGHAADRSCQNEHLDSSSTPSSSIDKKKSKKRKIKEAQSKAQSYSQGFGERASNGSKLRGSCKVCHGSGIVSDSHNNGYRCLCADGRSKSVRIPQVPEALFLSLRSQM